MTKVKKRSNAAFAKAIEKLPEKRELIPKKRERVDQLLAQIRKLEDDTWALEDEISELEDMNAVVHEGVAMTVDSWFGNWGRENNGSIVMRLDEKVEPTKRAGVKPGITNKSARRTAGWVVEFQELVDGKKWSTKATLDNYGGRIINYDTALQYAKDYIAYNKLPSIKGLKIWEKGKIKTL